MRRIPDDERWLLLALAGVIAVLATAEALQYGLGLALLGLPTGLARTVRATLPSWLLLAALLVPVLLVQRRLPPVDAGLTRRLLAHAAIAVAVTAAHLTGTAWIAERLTPPIGFRERLLHLATLYFVLDLLGYVAIVALVDGIRQLRAGRARAMRAAQARAHDAEARYAALRGRLDPDFFLNTLNAIAALVAQGRSTEGLEAIGTLGTLVRRTTAEPGPALQPLRDELQLIESYLTLQCLRFARRLTAAIAADPAAAGIAVPPLRLYRLLEGVVEHLLDHAAAGWVHVTIRARGQGCRIRLAAGADEDWSVRRAVPEAALALWPREAVHWEREGGDEVLELVLDPAREPAGSSQGGGHA